MEEILEMFKKGNRDANEAYARVKDHEVEIPKIVEALEQLSDILC